MDSPVAQGQPSARLMHLPSFAGARGTPSHSRPNSAAAGQQLSRDGRSGSLGV